MRERTTFGLTAWATTRRLAEARAVSIAAEVKARIVDRVLGGRDVVRRGKRRCRDSRRWGDMIISTRMYGPARRRAPSAAARPPTPFA